MRYLLDTHTFLWLATDSPRLGVTARRLALDPNSEIFLSLASVWEMAIKQSLGKLELAVSLERLVESQCRALSARLLPIELPHAAAVADLPFRHRDPFDRLLVAQALLEGLTLLSTDGAFDAYGVARMWD